MKHFFILLISLLSATGICAQEPSKEMIDQMTKIVADQIRQNYVLPEKGELIAEYFTKDQKKGRFYQATSLKKLDSIMCKSLREVSNDYHLYVWNNYDLVKQLQTEDDQKEEMESAGFFNNKAAYEANFGFERVEVLPENVGYIKLSQINISERSLKKLYAAMTLIEHTRALILDLRGNSGGGSTVGSVLETFFFDKKTDLLEFRSRNNDVKLESTVSWLLETRYLKPLYILVNKRTASAAEAFAFALKNQGRCQVIGQPSSGGAYMNTYFSVNEHFVIAISTSAPFLPGTTSSWESSGVEPDYLVDDENALSKAMELIKYGL